MKLFEVTAHYAHGSRTVLVQASHPMAALNTGRGLARKALPQGYAATRFTVRLA